MKKNEAFNNYSNNICFTLVLSTVLADTQSRTTDSSTLIDLRL